jgi:hypothetical protein
LLFFVHDFQRRQKGVAGPVAKKCPTHMFASRAGECERKTFGKAASNANDMSL